MVDWLRMETYREVSRPSEQLIIVAPWSHRSMAVFQRAPLLVNPFQKKTKAHWSGPLHSQGWETQAEAQAKPNVAPVLSYWVRMASPWFMDKP